MYQLWVKIKEILPPRAGRLMFTCRLGTNKVLTFDTDTLYLNGRMIHKTVEPVRKYVLYGTRVQLDDEVVCF
jgi:hypothetical protein